MHCCQRTYINVSSSKGKKLLQRDPNILLIDVRSPEEYCHGHIPGSFNIPLEVLAWEIDNLQLSPYVPIMVYCKTGIRAASAAETLLYMGFFTVYNLGGIKNWRYKIVP